MPLQSLGNGKFKNSSGKIFMQEHDGIIPVPEFRTFDFHEMEGQPQTDDEEEKIHNQIINHPDEPMTPGGESFDEAVRRALPLVEKLLQTNKIIAIVTHNSMYGLIKLWYENGRPKILTKKFRSEYINQDNDNPTGSYICMESDNGSEVYLIRHGETDDNEEGNFRSSDAVLTDKGKQQALDVGMELQDEGITKIYSSDLPRALETSEIIQTVNNTKPDFRKTYKLKK
jgi:broad specificity phosphatase PhoE